MSLKQSLKQIQNRARKKQAKEKETQLAEAEEKKQKEVARLRKMAEKEFTDYVEKLKDRARKNPDKEELRVDINYHNCYPFAKRLKELFAEEENLDCEVKQSTIEDYYGTGPTNIFSLIFKI